MRLVGLLFLIILPLITLGQASTSDTLTLKGIISIGNNRRQIDSIELIQTNKKSISFSTDQFGKFKINNLGENSYRLYIKELDYDTVFALKHDKQKELWIFIPVGCEVNEEIANQEISQGYPRLLLIGGIAPIYVAGQENFEKTFNVKYYDFGCTPPDKGCVIAYNKVVFNYLDRIYGAKWRKKVRTDVIGYKQ
jgi:hypothetical protein